jgi:hypothetical protein
MANTIFTPSPHLHPTPSLTICYLYYSGKGTATLALPSTYGQYDLYGYKWFTSATDSDMALTLARDTDANGQPRGTGSSKGLSMFFLKVPGIALRLKSQLTNLPSHGYKLTPGLDTKDCPLARGNQIWLSGK